MRAVIAPEPGGPEALQVLDRPEPSPGHGEVVIDVVAAGINRADVMQRMGYYDPPPGSTDVLGLEVSGRVARRGVGVVGFEVGAQVCALLAGGGYAERVAVPAGQVLPIPAGIDLVHAAGLPETACTVWSNLVSTAHLAAGEWLLVHGGSSGIGTTAIQVAKALGARVAVTAGSSAKRDRCRALGADLAINYHDDDFVAALREATDGRGADVVLDIIGAAYLERNVAVLAADGRLVVIGLQKGRTAEVDLGRLLAKRATIAATSLRTRPLHQKAAIVAAVRGGVWPMIAAGDVRPIIDSTYPLAEVATAHRRLEASDHIGKILLTL